VTIGVGVDRMGVFAWVTVGVTIEVGVDGICVGVGVDKGVRVAVGVASMGTDVRRSTGVPLGLGVSGAGVGASVRLHPRIKTLNTMTASNKQRDINSIWAWN